MPRRGRPGRPGPRFNQAPDTEFARWRQRHRLTRLQAAEILGYNKDWITQLERGYAEPSRVTQLAMLGYDASGMIRSAADIIGQQLNAFELDTDLSQTAIATLTDMLPSLQDHEIASNGGLAWPAHAIARSEGWSVWWNERKNVPTIQPDWAQDKFATDAEALDYVRQRAEDGSRLHRLALAMHESGGKE